MEKTTPKRLIDMTSDELLSLIESALPKQEVKPKLYSVSEAAKEMGCSSNSIYIQLHKGLLKPDVRRGARIYFRAETLGL